MNQRFDPVEGMGIKDSNLMVDMLVDVTAKNGILLLNALKEVYVCWEKYAENAGVRYKVWLLARTRYLDWEHRRNDF